MPPVVQITASPTTELSVSPGHGFRVSGPTPMMYGRISPVRRCLFGPSDAEERQKCLERDLKRIQEEKTKKWNFDFANEKPLPGPYEWQRVDRCQDADKPEQLPPPPFYRLQQGIKRPIDEATRLPSKWTRTIKKQRPNIGQTKMTDFMKSSKLVNESITKQRIPDDVPAAHPHFIHPVADDSSVKKMNEQ